MDELIAALETSHRRLAGLLDGLSEEQASAQSYDDDWSIGQVASHLGSGAEIFGLFLAAGAERTEPPGQDAFGPVWDRWNAKSAADQVRDAVVADRAFLDQVAAMSDEQRQSWQLDMFGEVRDLRMVLGMRLSEHALHTWDIEVAGDPSATVLPDAVEPILDGGLSMMVGRVGKPVANPVEVAVSTLEPARTLRLSLGSESASLTAESAGDGDATLSLPGEALIRLVYGRLDPDHTPADVQAAGVDLEDIRTAFPGV